MFSSWPAYCIVLGISALADHGIVRLKPLHEQDQGPTTRNALKSNEGFADIL